MLKWGYVGKVKTVPYQVYSYLVVGGANTVFNLVLFAILFSLLINVSYALEAATVIAFVVTAITGFWLNRNFAFQTSTNVGVSLFRQFLKYVFVSISGQFLDYVITKGMVVVLLMNPVHAYFSATIIILTSTFFAQKFFTFRESKHQEESLQT